MSILDLLTLCFMIDGFCFISYCVLCVIYDNINLIRSLSLHMLPINLLLKETIVVKINIYL